MQPGRLDTRITLTPPGTGVDEWNQPATGGGTPVVAWAGVFDVKVEDKVVGNAITAEATLWVLMRYRTDIDTKYTVTVGGVEYSVVHIAKRRKQHDMRVYLKVRE